MPESHSVPVEVVVVHDEGGADVEVSRVRHVGAMERRGDRLPADTETPVRRRLSAGQMDFIV